MKKSTSLVLLSELNRLQVRLVANTGDSILDVLYSGASIVFRSNDYCYKVRGLTPGGLGPVRYTDSQEITRREHVRLQLFGDDAVAATLIPLPAPNGHCVVLRTQRLDPLGEGQPMPTLLDLSREVKEVFDRRARPSNPVSIAPVLHHLEVLLDEVGATVPDELRKLAMDILGSLQGNSDEQSCLQFHGDLRIDNMGTSGGNLKFFDPAVLPHLYTTSFMREMSSLWASHIARYGVVPTPEEFDEQWGSHDSNEARTWISFNMIHRTLLTLNSRVPGAYAGNTAARIHPDDLVPLVHGVLGHE